MKPSFVLGLVSSSLTVIGFSVLASSFSSAKAASFTFDQSKLNLYGGSTPINFNVDLDDTAAGEGKVQFKVNVAQGFFADLRGVFFHMKDESLLGGLNVIGKDLTQVVKSANSVVDLGGGNNLNGDGKGKNAGSIAGGFDVGVEIGTQGIGKDDIRSTTFVVSHATKKLSLSDFADQLFGIRLMSVGANRDGSSKLTGTLPPLPPPPVVSQPASPKPAPQPVVSNPEPPKPLPQPIVSQPEPPKPPVVSQPEPPKPLPQPIVSQPEPPKPPVVSQPEPPKPVPQPIVSQPEPPKPVPQPIVSNPEPPKPPVASNPEPPKPAPQPIISQPEPPKPILPPVVIQPPPDVVKPVLPPVAIDPTPPKKQEPVEVPEPSTVFLALASVGALKLLKRKGQPQS